MAIKRHAALRRRDYTNWLPLCHHGCAITCTNHTTSYEYYCVHTGCYQYLLRAITSYSWAARKVALVLILCTMSRRTNTVSFIRLKKFFPLLPSLTVFVLRHCCCAFVCCFCYSNRQLLINEKQQQWSLFQSLLCRLSVTLAAMAIERVLRPQRSLTTSPL